MNRLLAASALLICLWFSAAESAFRIEYTTDRPDVLRACDEIRYRGERNAATDCYSDLLINDADDRIRAEAAWVLGDVRSANSYFQSAVAEFPEDPAIRVRWARLFSVTHQDKEAVDLYQEALGLDPKYVPAILGLAEVSAGRFEDQAREWVEDALDIDDESIDAHLLLARMELEIGNLDEAETSLARAAALAETREIAPLEIYALNASLDLLRDVVDSEWTQRALAYNASYGGIYATPAYFYVITRRYREAIELYQRAAEIEPDHYDAHAELGVNLLRVNRIEEAQLHLARAYSGDPYSARTVNTLRLIDSLDRFVVNAHGPDTEFVARNEMLLRLHEDEVEVLEPYIVALTDDAIDAFSERYEFDLKEPAIIEFYPDHDDFAVRTAGLPGIGLLGVTFGYLVAMDSPSGRAEGDFHWGTTLWHEMAHVFTLEATNHLVPRWFSEGVSVFEEWATGPLAGRHIPVSVFAAMAEEKFLPVAELDSGFIRPSYENQVIVSYMQAGMICEFIAERWGQSALVHMLGGFRDGLGTQAALEAALEISAAEFDSLLADRVSAEFGPVLENLEEWQETQSRVHAAAAESDWPAATAAAEQAVGLFPNFVDEGSPYLILAKGQVETGDNTGARETLAEYHQRGGYDPGALIQLARWARDAGDRDAALEIFSDMLLVAPLGEDVHAEYGDLLLEAGDAAKAGREYQALFALNPHDMAAAHLRLAKAYFGQDERNLANEHLLYALDIAPHYREAQQLLLEMVR
jgi:tetratricopeptide (TPR) repeat protein